jgi:hypothetical protein
MNSSPGEGPDPDGVTPIEGRRFHLPHQDRSVPFQAPIDDTEGYNLRPDPLTAKKAYELMRLLRQFRAWCGQPGYRVMSSRVGKRVSPSTLCTALASDRLPKLDTLQAIIQACSGQEEDVRRWTTAWRQITISESSAELERE